MIIGRDKKGPDGSGLLRWLSAGQWILKGDLYVAGKIAYRQFQPKD
jgi:hypothetical protein